MIEAQKKFDKKILLLALSLTTLTFIGGILVGYTLNNERLTTIDNDLGDVIREVQNFQIQFLFLEFFPGNSTCPLLLDTLNGIDKKSTEIGDKLITYSSVTEISDYDAYIEKKKEYSRLLTGYWLLSNKLKQTCDFKASTIIYLYAAQCPICDDQGVVLTYLKQKYGAQLLVFALDADLAEPSIKIIKDHYNIRKNPSLIIDGTLYEGFQSKEDLLTLLGLE